MPKFDLEKTTYMITNLSSRVQSKSIASIEDALNFKLEELGPIGKFTALTMTANDGINVGIVARNINQKWHPIDMVTNKELANLILKHSGSGTVEDFICHVKPNADATVENSENESDNDNSENGAKAGTSINELGNADAAASPHQQVEAQDAPIVQPQPLSAPEELFDYQKFLESLNGGAYTHNAFDQQGMLGAAELPYDPNFLDMPPVRHFE